VWPGSYCQHGAELKQCTLATGQPGSHWSRLLPLLPIHPTVLPACNPAAARMAMSRLLNDQVHMTADRPNLLVSRCNTCLLPCCHAILLFHWQDGIDLPATGIKQSCCRPLPTAYAAWQYQQVCLGGLCIGLKQRTSMAKAHSAAFGSHLAMPCQRRAHLQRCCSPQFKFKPCSLLAPVATAPAATRNNDCCSLCRCPPRCRAALLEMEYIVSPAILACWQLSR
jgi:hypothetical protein